MAKQKGMFLVLWVAAAASAPGFERAAQGLKDAEDGRRWIRQHGTHGETYQVARFCGPPLTVKVEKVEKRIITDAGATDDA